MAGHASGVFVCTAIAAVLSLFGLLHLEPKVKGTLFTALTMAIVGVAIAAFQGSLSPQNLTNTTTQVAVNDTTKRQAEATTQVQAALGQPLPSQRPLALSVEQKRELQLMGRFTIFIVDEQQRKAADELGRTLKEAGLTQSRDIILARKSPDTTEFRYFNFPEDTKLAQSALELGKRATKLVRPRISYVIESRPAGTLEIHFAVP